MINTWDVLELPVLHALADLEDQGVSDINQDQVVSATNLPGQRVHLALRRLLNALYVSAKEHRPGSGDPPQFLDIELTERGLRAAGAWPAA